MPVSNTLTSLTALVPSLVLTESAPGAKRTTSVGEPAPVQNEGSVSAEGSASPFSYSRIIIPINAVNRLEYVPAIVRGIITHYVDPDVRARLKEPADHLRLVEDLGLDSLTMMEIMIKVEDLLHVTVSDAELRHFRTLGDFRLFIDRSVRDSDTPGSSPLPAS